MKTQTVRKREARAEFDTPLLPVGLRGTRRREGASEDC